MPHLQKMVSLSWNAEANKNLSLNLDKQEKLGTQGGSVCMGKEAE